MTKIISLILATTFTLLSACAVSDRDNLELARGNYFRQLSLILNFRIRPPIGVPRGEHQPVLLFRYASNGDFLSAKVLESSGNGDFDNWLVNQINQSTKVISRAPVARGNDREFDLVVTYRGAH